MHVVGAVSSQSQDDSFVDPSRRNPASRIHDYYQLPQLKEPGRSRVYILQIHRAPLTRPIRKLSSKTKCVNMSSDLKLTQFKALVFDVYATLIVSSILIFINVFFQSNCLPRVELGRWHLQCSAASTQAPWHIRPHGQERATPRIYECRDGFTGEIPYYALCRCPRTCPC